MKAAELVKRVRNDAGLSLRSMARAAGVATSTIHRIEQGRMEPTVETLERIAQAAGARLRLEPVTDSSASAAGLARAIRADLDAGELHQPVRRAAEFAHRFRAADPAMRHRMITAEPRPIGDERWDALVAGLVEWLAVQTGTRVPEWSIDPSRFLDHGWWITSMESMRAWEYAGTPVSLQRRGVYIHRDSLTNV